ncbi:MAG: Pirin domain protein [Marmoricola sp.]|nr:Pirin domain protein [Marmoricola sp.]
MIEYRLAQDRFRTQAEGRTTWHSFAFGSHYDPANVGFESLVAHNDELLPPGTGYAAHPHADLEIVTWMLSGALRHQSSVGSGVIAPGQVQRLSAGSGVVHSEVADSVGPTRFLQAWVRPDDSGLVPDYVSADVTLGEGWACVADGDGRGVVPIAARGTSLHAAELGPEERLTLPESPRLHVFVARGSVMLGERHLETGDAARLTDEGGRPVTAEEDAHLVVWSFG